MPFTNFPNGVTSFGIPLMGSNPVSIPNLNGDVFFVDPVNGSDGNDGLGPSSPFKTVNHALTQIQGGTGSTIFMYPGTYLENVVVTAKSNVAFIACYKFSSAGFGTAKPLIQPTSGVPLTLNQCTGLFFEGIKINAITAATVGVLTDSNGAVFLNCSIQATGSGVKFLAATAVAFDGSGTAFINCKFTGCVNAIKCFVHTVSSGTQASNCLVQGCYFFNNSGADIADDASANVFWSGWNIVDSYFYTKAKAVYLAMSGNGSQTTTFCNISGNFFGATATMTTTMIALEAGSMFIGNYNTIGLVDGHTF